MKISFWGADRVVTGSCHCLTVNGKNILVDCGLQQGGDVLNNNALSFDARTIDAVLITHAHTDHSGRLPLLVKNGFNGSIYATRATCDLLKIMLLDSARIQESDAQYKQKKSQRTGEKVEEPLYSVGNAMDTLKLLVPTEYGQSTSLFENVTAEWYDAGHLLGSSSIRVVATENNETRSITFSGDIGNINKPIIRDPQPVPASDYVLMESTYGDRLHDGTDDAPASLASIIDKTLARGGNVIIPSFAVGRTQELLYFIREIKERNLVKSIPNFLVYVDSPLALEATKIYDGDLTGYMDEETIEVLKKGFKPISFDNLKLSQTSEESMMLNTDPTPKVIIASSGMCEAGRIRHHLKHNLWRKESSIVFVGYQSEGTMGRQLLGGLSTIKLFGEKVQVNAEIHSFKYLSSHADRDGLMRWLRFQEEKPKKIFVVHGEESSALGLHDYLLNWGYKSEVPLYQSQYDLIDGSCLNPGHVFISDREKKSGIAQSSFSNPVFNALQSALSLLTKVVNSYKEGTNKDISAFTEDIEALCDKWKMD